MGSRLSATIMHEIGRPEPLLAVAHALAWLLPVTRFIRLRARIYRLAGLDIGRGTILMGAVRLTGEGRKTRLLSIGDNCVLNDSITFNLGAGVTLGDRVAVGMQTLFLTVGHLIGDAAFRSGATRCAPIVVGSGAWIGARVTVLPGVTIGSGAVIAAGAVVSRDIPSGVVAGGVPARVLRVLADDMGETLKA